jgi:hypothetical protein
MQESPCTVTATGKFVSVSVSVHAGGSAQTMNLLRPSAAKSVSGLGSQAYCAGPLLAMLSGSNIIDVTAGNCAQTEVLARIVLPRV